MAGELRPGPGRPRQSAIYGGSYGWASAGRFHHAQGQLKRLLNLLGGFTSSRGSYSHGTSDVVLRHIVGDAEAVLRGGSSWSTIADRTELIVAFGGLPEKNVFVTNGGVTRHDTPGHLAAWPAAACGWPWSARCAATCPTAWPRAGTRWCPPPTPR